VQSSGFSSSPRPLAAALLMSLAIRTKIPFSSDISRSSLCEIDSSMSYLLSIQLSFIRRKDTHISPILQIFTLKSAHPGELKLMKSWNWALLLTQHTTYNIQHTTHNVHIFSCDNCDYCDCGGWSFPLQGLALFFCDKKSGGKRIKGSRYVGYEEWASVGL